MWSVRNFFLSALLIIVVLFSSWGFLVHRTVNQLAVYQLPKPVKTFFYQNLDTVVQNSIRPDQRRNSDPTEGTKHFIDLEMFGDSAASKMPRNWNDAVTKFTKDTLVKYGYLPYWVIAMQERLTNAFKSGNKDSILFYAADIAHYIGDAHVPLHTSFYYDGQNTNQRGIHALWESTVPQLEFSSYDLSTKHKAVYLDNPEQRIWEAIQNAHTLLPEMWQQEKEASKAFTDATKYRMQKLYGRDVKGYTTAFATAYNQRVGRMINNQMIRSSNLIADFWYTAWVNGGRANLAENVSRQLKKTMKREQKAFKKNDLIEKDILISKKLLVVDPSVTQ